MLLIASVISVADILIYVFKLDYWLAIAISFAIATCIIFINQKNCNIKIYRTDKNGEIKIRVKGSKLKIISKLNIV